MKYSDKLNYFNNKFCTIFTSPTNRTFSPQQLLEYFSGFIESIDNNGIMINSINKTKSYFFLDDVVSIAEEQTLDEEKNAKEIEEIKKAKEPILKEDNSPFLDITTLESLSKSH